MHFSYTCHTVVDSDLCLAIMIDTVSSDITAPINVSTTRIWVFSISPLVSPCNSIYSSIYLSSNIFEAWKPFTSISFRTPKFDLLNALRWAFLDAFTASNMRREHTRLEVENSYPKYHLNYVTVNLFHPKEIVEYERYNIKSALDLSRYQIYLNYALCSHPHLQDQIPLQ